MKPKDPGKREDPPRRRAWFAPDLQHEVARPDPRDVAQPVAPDRVKNGRMQPAAQAGAQDPPARAAEPASANRIADAQPRGFPPPGAPPEARSAGRETPVASSSSSVHLRGGNRTRAWRPATRQQPSLISRGEVLLFFFLLSSVIAMGVFLARSRQRVDAYFQSRALAVPLANALAGPAQPLLLYLANDDTGALAERSLNFPLPTDPNTRARVVLEKLLTEYAALGSRHPLHAGVPGAAGVDEVFLAPIPGSRGLLAVVDFTRSFIHTHPSGIEPETLTLLSVIATLHANLPAITQVHFLVDGEPCPTLAGHADLRHTYVAGAAQMAPGESFTSAPGAPDP